jgi:hypothetical protein
MIANGFRRIALAQGLLPERPVHDHAPDLTRTIAEQNRVGAVPARPASHGDKPAISAERERPA